LILLYIWSPARGPEASAVALVRLGRIGTSDDLDKAAVFLASEDSAYVNGIELFVNGRVAQIWGVGAPELAPGAVAEHPSEEYQPGQRRLLYK
jgi:hypothetical protein